MPKRTSDVPWGKFVSSLGSGLFPWDREGTAGQFLIGKKQQ